jgi:hypothetical protein
VIYSVCIIHGQREAQGQPDANDRQDKRYLNTVTWLFVVTAFCHLSSRSMLAECKQNRHMYIGCCKCMRLSGLFPVHQEQDTAGSQGDAQASTCTVEQRGKQVGGPATTASALQQKRHLLATSMASYPLLLMLYHVSSLYKSRANVTSNQRINQQTNQPVGRTKLPSLLPHVQKTYKPRRYTLPSHTSPVS